MIRIKEGFQGERMVVVPPYIRKRQDEDPFLSTLYITDIGYYPRAKRQGHVLHWHWRQTDDYM